MLLSYLLEAPKLLYSFPSQPTHMFILGQMGRVLSYKSTDACQAKLWASFVCFQSS